MKNASSIKNVSSIKNAVFGGVAGALLGAALLATGGSGTGTGSAAVSQADLNVQIALLQQQLDDVQSGVNTHASDLDSHAGDETLHRIDVPYMGLNYCVQYQGVFPSRNLVAGDASSELDANDGLLASIGIFAGDFAPPGFLFCQGQLLPISQNQALFSLLGTTYGGDGRTTFGLPDLRNRVPMHQNGNAFRLGQRNN